MTSPLRHYFAYGSNLCRLRLVERIGPCEVIARARLDGYRLAFHKRGADGSGKCDACWTGVPDDTTWGVVYRVDPAQRAVLDRIEGRGRGYDIATAVVHTDAGGTVEAYLYVADPICIDPALVPFNWYHAFVLAGAHAHRLPAAYIAALERVAHCADSDPARAILNGQILTARSRSR